MYSRKSLLFDKGTPWIKKGNNDLFDVTMGSYGGAEVSELVGLYILNTLAKEYGKDNIGLLRDDGLAVFKSTIGSKVDRIRKNMTKIFKELSSALPSTAP